MDSLSHKLAMAVMSVIMFSKTSALVVTHKFNARSWALSVNAVLDPTFTSGR